MEGEAGGGGDRWKGRQVEGETGGGGGRWNRTAVHKFIFEWTSSVCTLGPGARHKPTDGSRAVKKSGGMSDTIHTAGEKFTQCRRFVCLSLLKCCCRTNAWQRASRCEPRCSGLRSDRKWDFMSDHVVVASKVTPEPKGCLLCDIH